MYCVRESIYEIIAQVYMKFCKPWLLLCLQELSKASAVGGASKPVKPITVKEPASTANNEQNLDKTADT